MIFILINYTGSFIDFKLVYLFKGTLMNNKWEGYHFDDKYTDNIGNFEKGYEYYISRK